MKIMKFKIYLIRDAKSLNGLLFDQYIFRGIYKSDISRYFKYKGIL